MEPQNDPKAQAPFSGRRQYRLSRYYASKSRSFSQLSDALRTEHGESALALGKKRASTSDAVEIAETTIWEFRQLTINAAPPSSEAQSADFMEWCPIQRRVRRKMATAEQSGWRKRDALARKCDDCDDGDALCQGYLLRIRLE